MDRLLQELFAQLFERRDGERQGERRGAPAETFRLIPRASCGRSTGTMADRRTRRRAWRRERPLPRRLAGAA